MIGATVPPNEPVFAISQGGQSYLPRELLVGYESASNEVLQDILWTPVVRDFQPTRILKFDFPPRELRKLRVVQTASLPDNQWSIAELRIFITAKRSGRIAARSGLAAHRASQSLGCPIGFRQ